MINDTDLDDTPETAPAVPRTQAAVTAANARAMRESPQYKKRRGEFRAEGARQRNEDGTTGAPCWLCNQPIDFKLTYPHPMSWSLDHKLTVKERPDLVMDVENWAHSHYDCNIRRGTDDPALDLGVASEEW